MGEKMDLPPISATHIKTVDLNPFRLEEIEHEAGIIFSRGIHLWCLRKHPPPAKHLGPKIVPVCPDSKHSVYEQFHGVHTITGRIVKKFKIGISRQKNVIHTTDMFNRIEQAYRHA